MFEEYDGKIREVFNYFSAANRAADLKLGAGKSGDYTIKVDEVLELFRKSGIAQGIDGKPAHAYLKLEEMLACVEKFYSPEQRLDHKLHSKDLFE